MFTIFGLFLILSGVLIFVFENLLRYFVGGVFIMLGLMLIGTASRMRSSIVYRRLDETGEPPEPFV
jgi:hypothetical protein